MKRISRFSGNTKKLLVLLILMGFIVTTAVVIFVRSQSETRDLPAENVSKDDSRLDTPSVEPRLTVSELVSGLTHPWDIVFLPDQTLLFNERNGSISKLVGGEKVLITKVPDVYAVGEGGLTGLALDRDFVQNRFIYTCMNSQSSEHLDVRLVRWRLDEGSNSLTDRTDILTGIPSNRSGRHSGCRIRVAQDGVLWVGTGDAAIASNPQDPKSLGGKILRINRDGSPVNGNLPEPFDSRIFSYGHRNVQGIALHDESKKDSFGYSVEHGSDRDDEINPLRSGNFGWAPSVTYLESGVPMTDLDRFPEAIPALWSSGVPTIAPSGATILSGDQWGTWSGAVAMAVLKDRHVRIMKFDDRNKLIVEEKILTEFGRIRSAVKGPDNSLYLTTDNGNADKIIKVSASQ